VTIVESEQSREMGLTQIARGPFVFRYASYRKSEDAKLNLRSEDLIISELTPKQALFGICDGVGSSFYGNIGSQILAETILSWSKSHPLPSREDLIDPIGWVHKMSHDLQTHLNEATKFATDFIQRKELRGKAALIQLAEQTQRDDFGTQSNFAAGIIWPKSAALPDGLVLLFWLGNARLRIFNKENELTHLLGWGRDSDQLKEVWSSKEGVLGNICSYITDLSHITAIIAYSDGLEGVEEQIHPNISGSKLESLVSLAQSIKDDDISFLEISSFSNEAVDYSEDIIDILRDRDHLALLQPDSRELRQKINNLSKELKSEITRHKTTKQTLTILAVFLAVCILAELIAIFILGFRFFVS
jgi:hypothetical protein